MCIYHVYTSIVQRSNEPLDYGTYLQDCFSEAMLFIFNREKCSTINKSGQIMSTTSKSFNTGINNKRLTEVKSLNHM